MLYPSLADFWNQRTQSCAIDTYEEILRETDQEALDAMIKQAEEYNTELAELREPLVNYDDVPGYDDLLNIMGSGVMGYITIDKIKVELPIYHGVSPEVLNVAVGHLPGSSLPVGGKGTHCVLSAHRGLPSAKLFTDLDELQVGDTFTVTVFDRVIGYEVDQIRIVLPDEVDDLAIDPDEDYCTLFTCTPYGINSHRLLVRGVRSSEAVKKPGIYVANDVFRVDPMIVSSIVAVPMLLVLLIWLMVRYRKRPDDDPE